jgi:hypothetical protein
MDYVNSVVFVWGHKLVRFMMFKDIWGRYAPGTTADWSQIGQIHDVQGYLGSLRSRYDRGMVTNWSGS